jgi:orotidine-5'-phosphate decarboxylase
VSLLKTIEVCFLIRRIKMEMERFITRKKGIIVACDVRDLKKFSDIIIATYSNPAIVGYKVGMTLDMRYPLKQIVQTAKALSSKLIVYDRQKAASDIPDLDVDFADAAAESGVDAVIFFPFGGAETQIRWTEACWKKGLRVLIGGHMTQPKFLDCDGGMVSLVGVVNVFIRAARMGVRDFVLPGTLPNEIPHYMKILDDEIGRNCYAVYSPGLIKQGGDISTVGALVGDNFYGIVGRGIFGAKDIVEATRVLTSKLQKE